MATREDVVAIATAEVGYKAPQDPEAGSKYGRWMADQTGESWLRGPSTDVWWCNMFVSWVLAQAGQDCPGYPSYNTDTTLSANPTLVYREDVQPGDIVIWDWNSDGATDHVGIVSYHAPGSLGYIQCIEGNHNNAVEVVDRTDSWDEVAACIRPPYDEGGSAGKPDGTTDYHPEHTGEDYVGVYASRVIDGDYSNGRQRMFDLYDEVQGNVNLVLAGKSDRVTDDADLAFAYAVIDGDYGNGDERMYNIYATVQARVNELLA